jgi:phosphate transport system substrate-binding protein
MNRRVSVLLQMLCILATATIGALALADDKAIRGGGATFPLPIYLKWADDYKRMSGVDIAYSPLGSGGGVQQMEQKMLDFGASDVPLAPTELKRLGLLQFPAVVGGVVPVVNLSGIRSGDLKLTGLALAEIYLGNIRRWNDKTIADLNPGLDLPNTNITVVHRFDSSGTTFLWSDYLSRSSAEWKGKLGVANVLRWPMGVAEVGNEGVASSVQRTRGSIGYVEYAYARQHNLALASLRNRDGRFVSAGRASFLAAQQSASWREDADLDQLLIDREGAGSWPLTAATFVLLPTRPDDPSSTVAVMKFFDWTQREGKRSAMELDYVSMPDPAIGLISKRWATQVRSPQGVAVWPVQGKQAP